MAERGAGGWLSTSPRRREALARLSWDAEACWWKLRLYCAASGNDGVLAHDELHVAMDRKVTEAKARRLVAELVRHGHVEDVDGTYRMVGWLDGPLDTQPPAAVWTDSTQRERWARNKRLLRDGELCKRIKARDRNLCRYCGTRVNWNDKRGARGGTYDHVDPDGDNEFSNVVVSCRRCNGRKRDRTPEQAGMTLLRPGTTAEQASQAGPDPPTESTPGQPPVDSRLDAPSRTRASADRVDSGLTGGQLPNPPPAQIDRGELLRAIADLPPADDSDPLEVTG